MNNTNHINSFTEACKSVMESFGITIEEGELIVRQSPYPADATIVVIGVTGNLHGHALISMDTKTACYIASVMMGGIPTEMDETTKSAISELSNMMIGNAATLLSQQDVMIDITPPSVLTGDNIQISTNSLSVSMPFRFDNDKIMEFSLSAKEITC